MDVHAAAQARSRDVAVSRVRHTVMVDGSGARHEWKHRLER
jgi:hypothetical protein